MSRNEQKDDVLGSGGRPKLSTVQATGAPSLIFRGSLQTDGVSVSVIKQDQDSKAGGPRKSKEKKKEQEPYIGQLPITQLQHTTGKYVLLDPERRDLLVGTHENLSVDNKQLHRYTSNQNRKRLGSTDTENLGLKYTTILMVLLKLKLPFQHVIEELWILTFMATI
ncbi:unnamed protein product [Umbelopsis vinacea]